MRYTTAIFDAATLWHARLVSEVTTVHPVTNIAPEVDFGDIDPDRGYERVGLVVNPEGTQASWSMTSPAGREESFVLDAVARTLVPGTTTALAAWQRLNALSDLIEDTLYDRTTRAVRPLGFDGEINLGLAAQVLPDVYPIDGGGWGGHVTVSAQFRSKR